MGEDGPMETVEVSCTLTISDGDESGIENRPAKKVVRTMHLPVMQSTVPFAAIENPTAWHISDARMRCLVKTAAMCGLGLTMWSGDEFVAVDDTQERINAFAKLKSEYRMKLWKTAIVIKESYTDDSPSVALEAWLECSEEEKGHLWIAESKGGFFTQKERQWIRDLRLVGEDK